MAKSKIGKVNFKKVATNAIVMAGTGAAAHVLSKAVLDDNPETMDYIMIGAGLILPEVVKNDAVNSAGGALLAIGAYRMAERMNLAENIGIKGAELLPAQHAIASGWRPGFIRPGLKEKKEATPGATVQ